MNANSCGEWTGGHGVCSKRIEHRAAPQHAAQSGGGHHTGENSFSICSDTSMLTRWAKARSDECHCGPASSSKQACEGRQDCAWEKGPRLGDQSAGVAAASVSNESDDWAAGTEMITLAPPTSRLET